jgi:poly-gamma-glutamate capsule biosynthesis protein CapA/YwtB (metallophosphatase superfamily)
MLAWTSRFEPSGSLGVDAASRGHVGSKKHRTYRNPVGRTSVITLFLCGDVMIGRGVDQIQLNSVHPRLFEPSITNAGDYVRLAERANGRIPRPVAPDYVWGALDDIDALAPDARIINLETSTRPTRGRR